VSVKRSVPGGPPRRGSGEGARCDTDALLLPEGPYETGRAEPDAPLTGRDPFRFVDLVLAIQDARQTILGLSTDERELRMVLELVRCHDLGRIVTSTSLAASSGLSYGTAMRTIDDLLKREWIVKRAKTGTDRSFSLHPSLDLLARWQRFARAAEDLLRHHVLSAGTARAPAPRSRALKADSPVVPPLQVLDTKLPLGRALRVLVHADPTFTAMNALRRHFEMVLGVPITSRALSIDRLRAEIIANSRRAVSTYDIVACDLPWFGEMAQSDRFIALDDLSATAPFDAADIYPDALASARVRGRQFGVPIMTTAEMLVYRPDLLAEAGVEPPLTTGALVEAARRLHDPARGISGIAWNGGRGTPVGHTFMMVMSAFGRPILDLRRTATGFDAETIEGAQMRPTFLSAEARETAAYLLELKAFSPPEVLHMAWYDRAVAYARGRAAMAYSHTLLAPLSEVDSSSPAYRKTGYLPHPAGPRGGPIVPMGGYALAIPSNIASERVSPVWNALRTLTSASASKLYLVNGSLASPRVSVSKDPDIQSLSPVIGAVDAFNSQGIFRMWPRPPAPCIAEIIAIAGNEIHDFLLGAKSLDRALADAQNTADRMMRSQGFY